MNLFNEALERFKTTPLLVQMLVIVYLAVGIMKLSGNMVNNFIDWGYPGWTNYMVGVLEVLCAVGLVPKKTRKSSAILLAFIMMTASGTHIIAGEIGGFITTGLLFSVLVGFIVLKQDETENSSEP